MAAARPSDEAGDTERIVDFFDSVPVPVARRVLFYWQRNPALLSALWRLGRDNDRGGD